MAEPRWTALSSGDAAVLCCCARALVDLATADMTSLEGICAPPSSCSGLLKHAAATTPAAVTVPTLTFNVLQRPCAEAAMGGRGGDDGYE